MQASDTYLDLDDDERRTPAVVGPVLTSLLASESLIVQVRRWS